MNEHETNARNLSPPQAVARNVNELRHDLLTLLQLQWELLGADMQQCARGLKMPAIVLAAAVTLAVGVVPVALLAIAAGLTVWGVPLPLALLVAALLGAAGAIAAFWFAWRRLHMAAGVLNRSRNELRRNIETFKTLFTTDGAQRGMAASGSHPHL